MSEVIPDRVRAAVEAVVDEASFVAFLIVLAEDWQLEQEQERTHPSSPYSEGARGWQNGTVAAVLDAAAAWARASSKGLPLSGYTPSANPWRRCADNIYVGKVYE